MGRVFGPPGMPQSVVEVPSTKLHDAMQQPDLRKRLTDMGFDMPKMAEPKLVDFMDKEVAKWSEIKDNWNHTAITIT